MIVVGIQKKLQVIFHFVLGEFPEAHSLIFLSITFSLIPKSGRSLTAGVQPQAWVVLFLDPSDKVALIIMFFKTEHL